MRLFAAAALVLAMSSPSFACDETMSNVLGILAENDVQVIVIAPDDLVEFAKLTADIAGVNAGDVTGALVADFGGMLAFGLETKDGCFTPQPLPLPGQTAKPGVGA